MKIRLRRIAFALALAFFAMTFVNASWLAPTPRGYVRLVAIGGTSQQARGGGGACTAQQIEPPLHEYLAHSLPALAKADGLGAAMAQVKVAVTADGQFVLFGDPSLECRTDGHGTVRATTLADLRRLDLGHGYSADGGKTFPLRGLGRGLITSLQDAVTGVPDMPLLFDLSALEPAEAKRLVLVLKALHRDPALVGDGFTGPEGVIAPLREAFPTAWAFSPRAAAACSADYRALGWLGMVPESCRGGTILVPIDRQWQFAGWPDRLQARMAEAGARVVLTGPAAGWPVGLDLPEQVGDIPASFTGYVLVSDIWTVGPALKPAYNKRNPYQEARLAKALEARRAARE